MPFFPKKPVKSFQDLEVYQRSLEANVFVVNALCAGFYKNAVRSIKSKKLSKEMFDAQEIIIKTLLNRACLIPHLIAEAHSFRFGAQKECLILLEKVMLNCNKMVVYLDQARDICQTDSDTEQFEELQKKYLFIRRKVLNLQRSWQKYMNMPKEEKIMKSVAL
jgi:hypothetical protein